MEQIRLSPRLKAAVSFVAPGARVADVGTDHGYIAVYLAQNGAKSVIASDLRAGPLDSARRSAREYGAEKAIDFVLSDGLTHLNPESADTVIIAGLGGETIAEILTAADWTRRGGHRFILQPMSKLSELTRRLYENGFSVRDAKLVLDSGTIYCILLAEAKPEPMPDPAGLSVPLPLLTRRDPLLGAYLSVLIERGQKALAAMKQARGIPEGRGALETELSGLIKIKEALDLAESDSQRDI